MPSKTLTLSLFLFISVVLFSQTEPDTVKSVKADSGFVMSKSPMGAVLRSAIIPGWGQYYNESYWKIPVVWGFLGFYTYYWYDRDDLYVKYKNLYDLSDKESTDGARLKKLRDFYQDQRDQFVVYFGLAYLLNLADAYVDAHLFDFDVSENPYTGTMQLNMRLNLR